jgi:hypothetical protein
VTTGLGFLGLGFLLMLPLAGMFLYAWRKDRRQRQASAVANIPPIATKHQADEGTP